MGTKDTVEHLYTPNNQEVFKSHEKERIHRDMWSRIYTHDDDTGVEETENTVRENLNLHLYSIYPYEHSRTV